MTLFKINVLSKGSCSIFATQWRQGARASGLHRTHSSEAVLRQDQDCRDPSCGEKYGRGQGSGSKVYQGRTGESTFLCSSSASNTFQSGNDKYDLERAEQQAKERAKAHIRFEQTSKKTPPKRKADEGDEGDEDSRSSEYTDSSSQSSEAEPEEAAPAHIVPNEKSQKMDDTDSAQTSGNSTPRSISKKGQTEAGRKSRKKIKRERKRLKAEK